MQKEPTNTLTARPRVLKTFAAICGKAISDGKPASCSGGVFRLTGAEQLIEVTYKFTGNKSAEFSVDGRSQDAGEYFTLALRRIAPGETGTIRIDLASIGRKVHYFITAAGLEVAGVGELRLEVDWR